MLPFALLKQMAKLPEQQVPGRLFFALCKYDRWIDSCIYWFVRECRTLPDLTTS